MGGGRFNNTTGRRGFAHSYPRKSVLRAT